MFAKALLIVSVLLALSCVASGILLFYLWQFQSISLVISKISDSQSGYLPGIASSSELQESALVSFNDSLHLNLEDLAKAIQTVKDRQLESLQQLSNTLQRNFEEIQNTDQDIKATMSQHETFFSDLLDLYAENITVAAREAFNTRTDLLTQIVEKTANLIEHMALLESIADDQFENVSKIWRQTNTHPIRNIRLVDGADNYGRVEIYYLNQWGTICDKGWDMIDAQVVCGMLGFRSAISLGTSGGGMGPIWLKNLRCSGREADILDCNVTPGLVAGCNHTQDASVVCKDR